MKRYIICADTFIKDALKRIDVNGVRSLVVVDEGNHYTKVVDESDIRRHLLNIGTMTDSIASVSVPTNQVVLQKLVPSFEVKELFEKFTGIDLIPVINGDRTINFVYSRDSVSQFIPVSQPHISHREVKYVEEAVRSTWVSSQGKFINRFTGQLENFLEVKHVSLTSNGTTAIELALLAHGIGPGDKVVVPSFTFAATANAVVRVGAEPIFVDVDLNSWNLDFALCRDVLRKHKVSCILGVEVYGNPLDIYQLSQLASVHDSVLIIDAAESFGAKNNGARTSSYVDAYTFSFFGNKLITTGEGGCVAFKDAGAFERAEVIKAHGMTDKQRYIHGMIGGNFRLTNMQAAVGAAQMEMIDEILEHRKSLFIKYSEMLNGDDFVQQDILEKSEQAPWLYSILINSDMNVSSIVEHMRLNGIECRRGFYPLHLQKPFEKYVAYENGSSVHLSNTMLTMPTYFDLKIEQVIGICDTLIDFIH